MRLLSFFILAAAFWGSAGAVRAQSGCIDSVEIRVFPVNCYGLRDGVIRIDTVFGGVPPFYYSLDNNSFSTRPEFDRLWAGEYDLYVRDANGCIFHLYALVPDAEPLSVDLSAVDTVILAGETAVLTAQVSPPHAKLASITWSPAALFPAQASLTQTARPVESLVVWVEVRDSNGCSARAGQSIRVEEPPLFFPNVFMPGSADNGAFTVFGSDVVASVELMQVFSRNGSLLFEQHDFAPNDPTLGWHGRWRGRTVQPGVYSWLTIVRLKNGQSRRYLGSVTVVR